jgi:CBS domain-containing protein
MPRAKDIMTKEVICVSPETEVVQVAKLLLEKHLNGLPVLDRKGRLVGMICQSDLIFQQKKIPLPSVFTLLDSPILSNSPDRIEREVAKMAAITVEQAMTPDPVSVDPETPLEEIATIMVKRSIHSLPVLDRGRVVGMIGKEDLLRTLMPVEKK